MAMTLSKAGAARIYVQGNDGNDRLRTAQGSGNDTMDGGEGDDRIDSRFGSDEIDGGAGDDVIISRSDWGEVEIAQDPDAPLYFADQPREHAHDLLTGGEGADTFLFRVDINATEAVVREHTMENGRIHWHGVAGENDNLHDHWVDGIGNDTITDFDAAEGDEIKLVGHTVAIGSVETVDADNDGAADDTLITVISDQGAMAGRMIRMCWAP